MSSWTISALKIKQGCFTKGLCFGKFELKAPSGQRKKWLAESWESILFCYQSGRDGLGWTLFLGKPAAGHSSPVLQRTHLHPTGKEGSAHLHLVAVEEVDVRFVLLRILAHQEEDGGIAHLVQHRLAVLDCGQREVLQLLLEKKEEAGQRGSTELLGSLPEQRELTELVLLNRDLLGSSNTRVTVCSGLGLHRTRKEVDEKQNSCSPEFLKTGAQWEP